MLILNGNFRVTASTDLPHLHSGDLFATISADVFHYAILPQAIP